MCSTGSRPIKSKGRVRKHLQIRPFRLHNTDTPIPADAEKYQEVELFNQSALFSNGRIKQEEIPDGLFCYDLRGSDYDPR